MFYQHISVCPRTVYTIRIYAQLAIEPLTVRYRREKACHFQFCEKSEKCSREAHLSTELETISWRFETSRTQKIADVEIRVTCPHEKRGRVNTVYLDQITVG
jgi:hypothetical protein